MKNIRIKLLNFEARVVRKLTKNKKLTSKMYLKKNVAINNRLGAYNKLSDHLDEENNREPKNSIIWTGWLQGVEVAPKVVKYCFNHMQAHSNGHEVICITEENLVDYLPDFPEVIIKKYKNGKILPAHYMDIIRIKLLRRYGGIWIDATVLLTQDVSSTLFDTSFYSYRGVPNGWHSNPADYKWTTFFLEAQANSRFMARVDDILDCYWKENNSALDYYLLDYVMQFVYDNDINVRRDVDRITVNKFDVCKVMPILTKKYNKKNLILSQSFLKKSKILKLTYKGFDSEGDSVLAHLIK